MTTIPGRTAADFAEAFEFNWCQPSGLDRDSMEALVKTLREYAKQEVENAQAIARQLHDNREAVWKSHIDLVASESRKKVLTQAAAIVCKAKESCGCADEYYTNPRWKEVRFAKAMLESAQKEIEALAEVTNPSGNPLGS